MSTQNMKVGPHDKRIWSIQRLGSKKNQKKKKRLGSKQQVIIITVIKNVSVGPWNVDISNFNSTYNQKDEKGLLKDIYIYILIHTFLDN